MTNLKIFIPATRNNEDGYVIISALMVLVLVTIIGVMSVRTSNSDLEISTNDHFLNRSFYAAEASRAFVYSNPVLYSSNNITFGSPVGFPDDADPDNSPTNNFRGQEAFRGTVEYLNSSVPYRGSGFAVGKFKAHNYRMICEGHAQYNGPTRFDNPDRIRLLPDWILKHLRHQGCIYEKS